ncbi:MAG: anthranilate synthase component I, partial [Isosphaeraceae bacterium]|nr:anthranilate synthase component I [Isosphaeraceae bacterium]
MPVPPRHRPGFDEFRRLAEIAPCVPVYRQLTADSLTPVSAFQKIARGGPAFLFESVIGGEKVGRYSFLGTEPYLRFEARRHRITVSAERLGGSLPGRPAEDHEVEDPLEALRELIDRYRAVHLPGLPRFCGGAVGYAAYDAVRYVEHLPDAPPDDRGLPDLAFNFYDRMVLFDHIRKTVLVVAHVFYCDRRPDLRDAYESALAGIDELVARLSAPGPDLPLADIDTTGPLTLQPRSNFHRDEYEAIVRRYPEFI